MSETLDVDDPILDNKAVGRNFQVWRKMADIKAHDIAAQLGMSEAAYTKFERGEANITIELVKKVAVILKVNPLFLLTVTPTNIIESGNHSPGAILGMVYGSYNYQGINEQQSQMIMKLMESVTALSNKVLEVLDKQKD